MNRKICVLFFLLASFAAAASAQNDNTDPEDVVKITSQIVQLDAVVTDKDNRQVTDLTADDFEILQDGKRQKITNFSYVPTGTAAPQNAPVISKKGPIVPSKVRPSGQSRVITFVVDDGNCRASLTGMRATRDALQKFVRNQMLSDDMVAIYQTRSGSSVFQQYTNDKNQLLRAAGKIKWYPPPFSCGYNDGSFFDAARVNNDSVVTGSGVKTVTLETDDQRKRREANEDFGNNSQVVGTMGVLQYAIRGLERIPGRKVVFFLSDGMPFRGRNNEVLSAADRMRDLSDLANRFAVTFNTIDVRGTFDPSMIEARDAVSTLDTPAASDKVAKERRDLVFLSQDGMAFLAHETGGNFYSGQNELDVPVGRALELEKGYYLLAYEPDDDTFKGKNFNKIEIKVKRPNLKISSRSGFLGFTDKENKPKARSGESELYEAIIAPLPRAGMNVGLTAFFGNSAAAGNFVRSLVHLQGSEITFVDEPGGMKKAVFDIVAVTMDEKNKVVDEFTRQHTLKFDAAAMPTIMRHGVVYSTDVPVKRPGSYNFRVAVRDANSKMLGSANQVIEVPDLKKRGVYISGLSAAEVDANGKFSVPEAANLENAFAILASDAGPATRRMRRGTVIAYPYTIYNARLASGGKPNLTVQVNLYHQGELITEGKPQPADLQPQSDWSRIADFGYLRLNPKMQPGDYTLEVIVRDLSAEGKAAVSSQWTDFEVIE